MATVTGGMVLLWFFLASGSSAPGRTQHGGGRAAWIMGTLGVPRVQGHQLPQPQELRTCVFFDPLEAGDQRASLAGPTLLLGLFRHLHGPLNWGPSLLFGASGT